MGNLWPGRDRTWYTRTMAVAVFVLLIVAVVLSGYIVQQVLSMQAPAHRQVSATTTATAQGSSAVVLRPAASACPVVDAGANDIQAENLCPGTDQWREDHPLGPTHAIEAYTVPASVNGGETLSLYVTTTAPHYRFSIYRIGWYQGLGAHLLFSSPPLAGIAQPAPRVEPVTRMVSADNWRSPVKIIIPREWVTGVYIVKLVSTQGYMRYTPFVLRDDRSNSQLLVQLSFLTYQAYNLWGGYDLYRGLAPGLTVPPAKAEYLDPSVYVASQHAYAVSLDRPLWDYEGDAGLGDFARYEINLVCWLERMGYDLSYSVDTDTHARGALLMHHKIFMVAGHDEYWSTAMRRAVEKGRTAGVSLAFMGANDIYWHVRLQASPLGANRVEVCYKPGAYDGTADDPVSTRNPSETTTEWRNPPLNQPEDAVMGEMYHGSASGSSPLVLAQGAAPLLVGTHLTPGDGVPGLIFGEYDAIYPDAQVPSSLSVLAASPVECIPTTLCPASRTDIANATLYVAPSGAKVFDAGTFQWQWGLDDTQPFPQLPDHHFSTPDFQRFTANIIAYLLSRN